MRDLLSVMGLSRKHQARFKNFIKQKVMKHVKALEGGAVAQQRMEGDGVKKRHSPLKFRM
jgi:hypothetical protein